jgi:hypothetical protein
MRRRPSDQACGAGFDLGCHRQSLWQRPAGRAWCLLKSGKPRALSMLSVDGRGHDRAQCQAAGPRPPPPSIRTMAAAGRIARRQALHS